MPALQEALYSQPSMAGSVMDMSASWSAKVAIDFEQQVRHDHVNSKRVWHLSERPACSYRGFVTVAPPVTACNGPPDRRRRLAMRQALPHEQLRTGGEDSTAAKVHLSGQGACRARQCH